ncbi:unnamed protein product [Chrysoparadoxa australica]
MTRRGFVLSRHDPIDDKEELVAKGGSYLLGKPDEREEDAMEQEVQENHNDPPKGGRASPLPLSPPPPPPPRPRISEAALLVVIDGMNVAWRHGLGLLPSFRGVKLVLDWFQTHGCATVAFVPQSRIQGSSGDSRESKQLLLELQAQGALVGVPAGDDDDVYMIRYALRHHNGYLVSNDRLRNHIAEAVLRDSVMEAKAFQAWVQARRISYAFRQDEFLPNPELPLIIELESNSVKKSTLEAAEELYTAGKQMMEQQNYPKSLHLLNEALQCLHQTAASLEASQQQQHHHEQVRHGLYAILECRCTVFGYLNLAAHSLADANRMVELSPSLHSSSLHEAAVAKYVALGGNEQNMTECLQQEDALLAANPTGR